MKFRLFLIPILFICFIFSSCKKEENFNASITVVNTTQSEVTNFSIKGIKSFNTISSNEDKSFNHEWVGKTSQLFGSTDNSNINLSIKYYIGDKEYNITNEKDALTDSDGNYFSDKVITDGSKIKIKIRESEYEIVQLN